MPSTNDQAFVNKFSDDVYIMLREGGSKLMSVLPTALADQGEKHFFNRLDKLTVTELESRNTVLDAQDAPNSRRMATVRRYGGRIHEDDIDSLKTLIDPTNAYAKCFSDAQGENYDITHYDAMLGTAATGKDGTGSQAFLAANQVANNSAGLTVAKLKEALRILETNEVDLDRVKLYCSIGGIGIEDLANDTTNQFTSFDFQDKKMLSDSGIVNFRGVNIIRTQRVPDETAGTTFRALMFTNDSMKTAMPKGLEIRMDERIDLAHVQQISAYMMFGTVRMEENKIIDILYQ